VAIRKMKRHSNLSVAINTTHWVASARLASSSRCHTLMSCAVTAIGSFRGLRVRPFLRTGNLNSQLIDSIPDSFRRLSTTTRVWSADQMNAKHRYVVKATNVCMNHVIMPRMSMRCVTLE
jgi:hypothetical protein